MGTTMNATYGRSSLAGGLLRSGVGLFALGLTTGLGLVLHYFYVTPFEMCSASFATMTVTEVWPWALPLLATEGFAVALAALGLRLISQARHGTLSSCPFARGTRYDAS
jgi:H+/Cl- antiporter ClcA